MDEADDVIGSTHGKSQGAIGDSPQDARSCLSAGGRGSGGGACVRLAFNRGHLPSATNAPNTHTLHTIPHKLPLPGSLFCAHNLSQLLSRVSTLQDPSSIRLQT